MNEQPSYFSVIPAYVRYDKTLKPMEIIMYGEISALTNKYGYAYASNNYFAKLYDVHKKTVSIWINHLKERGYITTEVIRNEDKTVKARKIYLSHQPYPQNHGEGYPQKSGEPIHEKTEENNTRENNTSINRDSVAEIFSYISNELEMIQSSLKVQEIEHLVNDLGNEALDIVKVATNYTRDNNKGINYLIKVLTNWSKEEVDTKEKAENKVKPKNLKQPNNIDGMLDDLLGSDG